MLAPRYKKILRDLLSNKSKTLLVVLSISIGVFSFASVFVTQELLLVNMQDLYQKSKNTNISLSAQELDTSLLHWIKTLPQVKSAQLVNKTQVKLITPAGKEENLQLTALPNFNLQTLNIIKPNTGRWPPQKGDLVLERASFNATGSKLGSSATIKINEQLKSLYLSGTVYDNTALPYIFTNQMIGFISFDTLGLLGLPKVYNQLQITTQPNITTLDQAEKFTSQLIDDLKDRGVIITSSRVLPPNQHWAQDNSQAFTAILSIIGIFSLILSGFLVINTISALLSEQKKQIGILKSIGAKRKQIIDLYLITVTIYGLLALVVALPVGMFLGRQFLGLISGFLNLDIPIIYFPLRIILMEIAAALFIPIIAAIIPIIQSSKLPIRHSLSDVTPTHKSGKIEVFLSKIQGLNRLTLMSLRNIFRKKGRLLLTLITLTVAGAVFIAVLNVRQSMYQEIDIMLQMYDFEVSLNLDQNYQTLSLIKRVEIVSKVSAIEARTSLIAKRVKSDGSLGNQFSISGLPYDTIFSHPTILSGRWLDADNQNQIVLGSSYIRDNPDLKVGDTLTVDIDQEQHKFDIVGIVTTSGREQSNFALFSKISSLKDRPNQASSLLIKTNPQDPATQLEVLENLKNQLDKSNITVVDSQTKTQIYDSVSTQFNFMIFFLLTMSVMIASVGGLGLAGTMSLNILERTREIGIMRSIGASSKAIRKIVNIEGVMVAFISFLFSLPLSIAFTYMFCYTIGNAFFDRTLSFAIVPLGALIWLSIVIVIALFASLVPANRASRISIRETLSYE